MSKQKNCIKEIELIRNPIVYFDAQKNYDGTWTVVPRTEITKATKEDLCVAFMCGGLREDYYGEMKPDGTISYIYDYATWMEKWLKDNNKTVGVDEIYNYLNEIGIY